MYSTQEVEFHIQGLLRLAPQADTFHWWEQNIRKGMGLYYSVVPTAYTFPPVFKTLTETETGLSNCKCGAERVNY